MFFIQNMRIVNAYELASRRMFLLTKGKWARVNLMSGERSFLNLFRDSRTPLDSIGDKLVTLIYFVIIQCPSVGTTWFGASCARNGFTRFKTTPEGEWLCIVCRSPDSDVFVIVKVLFWIPQQLIIIKIRK